ncbi:sigma-70 RNA polymerase sigma factor region 4 domain-containing protein [Sphingobacterium bovistauri]|uniref:Sigma-70 family RNA polymerase sigma factor n=1 Tax=Sphingobacterium bovistauri TaxID=2781959 RepID=A0ABS7Z3T1_9SPHI|nr:hypothetical protein [Sphingobacterium bovistauri]MCA5004836.1 sigma-70 family RNA polymerase sigma factor [Sphingobacterium bovistauri]
MKTIYLQMKSLGVLVLFLLLFFNAKSQSDNDIDQQNVYNYLYSYAFDDSKKIIHDSFLRSPNDSKKVIGFVLLSRYYHIQKNDAEQLKSLKIAKQLAERTGSEIDQAYVELGFCFIYLKAKNYKQYIKSFNYATTVFNKTANNNSLLAILHSQKAGAGESIKDKNSSKQDYILANQFAIKSKVPYYIFITYNNLGNYYMHEYKTQKIDSKSDTSEYYFNKSYQTISTIKNAGLADLAKCLNYVNVGTQFFNGKNINIDSAIYLQQEALKIINNNPKLKIYESAAYINTGVGYELKKDFKNAKESYLKAISKLNKSNSNDYNHYELLRNLSHIYKEEGELDKAYGSLYQSYMIFRDINSGKNEKNFQLIQSLYENQIKENEILQLNEKTQLLNKQNILFLVILLVTSTLIVVLVYLLRLNKKVGRQKSKLLQKEKIRLVNESTILKLQHEKTQRDALAISLKLDNKNSVLKSLNDDLQKNKLTSIEKILKEDKHNDENYKQTQNIHENIHPKFFQKLNELSKQKLTSLDLKYASFIYLNMDNQDIANILKIDINTVRVTKYRLKIKLGLSKNEDLSDFIQQVSVDTSK